MKKSKLIFYALVLLWWLFMAFIVTFLCVQWGYSNGKSFDFSDLTIPSHSQRIQNKLSVLMQQRQQNNDRLTICGLTYIATYDVNSKSVEIRRLPRYSIDNAEIPGAWERYLYFWGFEECNPLLTFDDFYNIFNTVTAVKGTKTKLFAFGTMMVGCIGYNQGKDIGFCESYLRFIDTLDDIWKEEDAEVEIYLSAESWDKLLSLIDSSIK